MIWRMARAEIKQSWALSIALTLLLGVASTLITAGVLVSVRTGLAVDHLWQAASPPDVVQMHTGELDEQAVLNWASQHEDIADTQAQRTLPIPGNGLWIAGKSQVDSALEPAVISQPDRFDFLLGTNGHPARPQPGEVVMPVHYLATGEARVGDEVRIRIGDFDQRFTIIDFARDPLMNPSLVTSKRMVLHPDDVEALAQHVRSPEYIIAFKAKDVTDTKAILEAYAKADIGAKGIGFESPILKAMNAFTTMLTAVIILVIALLLVGIALLALRFALLTTLAGDLPTVGTLQAIGLHPKHIKALYIAKYLILVVIAVVIGVIAGWPLAQFAQEPVTIYLGNAPLSWIELGTIPLTVIMLLVIVLSWMWHVLGQSQRLSVMETLRYLDTAPAKPRWSLVSTKGIPVPFWLGWVGAWKRQHVLIVFIIAVSAMVMAIPIALTSTVSDPRFLTSVGIAQADIRIDVRDPEISTQALDDYLPKETAIRTSSKLITTGYQVEGPEGPVTLYAEYGDHRLFPLEYAAGTPPTNPNEIALSVAQAEAFNTSVGQSITLEADKKTWDLTVTGTYQDLTNGGKTAKVALPPQGTPLWTTYYINTKDSQSIPAISNELIERIPGAKVTDMAHNASQTMGTTSRQLEVVSVVTAGATAVLLGFLTVLFVILAITREQHDIAALRAIGFTLRQVRLVYITRFVLLGLIGIVLGVVGAQALGNVGLGAIFSGLGAPGVELIPVPWISWGLVPLMLLLVLCGATALGARTSTQIPIHITE